MNTHNHAPDPEQDVQEVIYKGLTCNVEYAGLTIYLEGSATTNQPYHSDEWLQFGNPSGDLVPDSKHRLRRQAPACSLVSTAMSTQSGPASTALPSVSGMTPVSSRPVTTMPSTQPGARTSTVCVTSACVSNSLQLGVTTVFAPADCPQNGPSTIDCPTSTAPPSTTVCLTSACVSESLELGVTTVTAPARCPENGANTLVCITSTQPPSTTTETPSSSSSTSRGTACVPSTAPTSTDWVVWRGVYAECQVIGMTPACGSSYSGGAILASAIGCDSAGESSGGADVSYGYKADPQPQSWDIPSALKQCDRQKLNFDRQCDGYVSVYYCACASLTES